MKLAIINGSPRNKKSNSKILTDHFLNGYNRVINEEVPVYYLADGKHKDEIYKAFNEAETILIIFPLYTDCMPGIVKEFFENLALQKPNNLKKTGFIVQSGFPESIHSINLEHYLEKLCQRLQYEYIGTVIKGGVEGIQVMPTGMTRKLFLNFRYLGEYFGKTMTFSPEIKIKLAHPYKMSFIVRVMFSAAKLTGITNYYWNYNLKKNGAYSLRFDRPYQVK